VWYKLNSKTLMVAGLTGSDGDKCLFYGTDCGEEVFVLSLLLVR